MHLDFHGKKLLRWRRWHHRFLDSCFWDKGWNVRVVCSSNLFYYANLDHCWLWWLYYRKNWWTFDGNSSIIYWSVVLFFCFRILNISNNKSRGKSFLIIRKTANIESYFVRISVTTWSLYKFTFLTLDSRWQKNSLRKFAISWRITFQTQNASNYVYFYRISQECSFS